MELIKQQLFENGYAYKLYKNQDHFCLKILQHTIESEVTLCIDDMENEINDINVPSFGEITILICGLKLRQKRESILVDRYF